MRIHPSITIAAVLMVSHAYAAEPEAAKAAWSFGPLTRPAVPRVDDGGWSRNPIDKFIFEKLQAEGLTPAPQASRHDLARRVYFDLIGLPPTPRELDAYLTDESPRAYERFVERLLEDPRYGQRWARHWLDVVRYAESDGYKADVYRPDAWRYRDYVIASFNADKPYDRFVQEQLAGDELFPGDLQALVATGYLRHGPYEDNQADIQSQWELILTEVTDTTGEVFMGMSMGCARCHNHKFDPIPQTDYYRFRAFFEAMRPSMDLAYATEAERAEHARRVHEWEQATAPLREQVAALENPYLEKARVQSVTRYPKSIQAIIAKPADALTPYEQQLLYLANIQTNHRDLKNYIALMSKEDRAHWDALQKELRAFDALKPEPLPQVLGVTDAGSEAPQTLVGESGQAVGPGVPSALGSPLDPIVHRGSSTGRRAALAQWLTRPDNPMSSRVIVNRIWHAHFGRGLVATTSDFGHLGEPPTHPQLLDWLAVRFVHDGWSFKPLHRLIVTSATYRQSAVHPAPQAAMKQDPDNRWLWRMRAHRLDAEQIRDAMLRVSGELDPAAAGPAAPLDSPRRSIYLQVKRNTPQPLLDAFDCPTAFGSTPVRHVTTTASQALMLMNDPWVLGRARAFAEQLQHANPHDTQAQIQLAYRMALAREPGEDEAAQAADFIAQQSKLIEADGKASQQVSRHASAMADFCHMLLNSNEFLYVR